MSLETCAVMKEECGIFAAYSFDQNESIAKHVQVGLERLQHRGQLSAGITTLSQERVDRLLSYRGMGLVTDVFSSQDALQRDSRGFAGIGHVRYATSGGNDLAQAQPFQCRAKREYSFAFNGNIANYPDLLGKIKSRGHDFVHPIDTAVIQHCITEHLSSEGPFSEIPFTLERTLDGAYSIIIIDDEGRFLAYRDHHGFKPLCYTQVGRLLLVASESVALETYGTVVRSVPPGHALWFMPGSEGVQLQRIHAAQATPCFFEYVYFSRDRSTIDDVNVGESRIEMGQRLAGIEDVAIDETSVVMAVPESAKLAGFGFANTLGIPLSEGIEKNKNAGRTFIETVDRQDKVRKKFHLSPDAFKAKKVFLVDDSLVRSTTIRVLVEEIKLQCESAEIHLRIACPPILSPCFYGIDIPNASELFARLYSDPIQNGVLPEPVLSEMARVLGVNSVKFLPIESLIQSIGGGVRGLCMACINGTYPTQAGQKLAEEGQTSFDTSVKELSIPSDCEKSCDLVSSVGIA